jgi:anti-sigma regulatory factor (Ser/Thr protein kinase)
MSAQLVFPIEDSSQVGNARRAATELASQLGFDAEQTGKVALAITEASTNILKHAQRGRVLLRGLEHGASGLGIELLALDRGPGINNVAASLRDGHSTTGTPGTGLGALARLSSSFEVYSLPARGTALRLVLFSNGHHSAPEFQAFEIGGVCTAKSGEPVSGDDWHYVHSGRYLTVVVADGLGHGVDAAKASHAATNVLHHSPSAEPHVLLGNAHAALAATRGAAMAAIRLDSTAQLGSFAGIGNIIGRVEAGATRHLVSHHGTVGHNVRKIQEFAFPWPTSSLVVLHSDGLATHWNLADYPGLSTKHPALIAGVLYRDFERGRDDVTAVVVRNGARR